MKKYKNKDQAQKVPASERVNRNLFLLLIAQEDFQSEMRDARVRFRVPHGGFMTNDEISNWHGWLCEDADNRLNEWRNFVTSILQKNDLHDGFRDAVEFYISWNPTAWQNVKPVDKVSGNYRISRQHSNHDKLIWKSVFVEFLGPVSKSEMLTVRTQINKLMSAVMKSRWDKPIASKLNLGQAFEDYECYMNYREADGYEVEGITHRRSYRDLIDEDEKMKEKDILRQAETKRKSIQKFKQKIQKKK